MIPSYRILSTVLTYKQEVNIPSFAYFIANMPSTVVMTTRTSIIDVENLIKLFF